MHTNITDEKDYQRQGPSRIVKRIHVRVHAIHSLAGKEEYQRQEPADIYVCMLMPYTHIHSQSGKEEYQRQNAAQARYGIRMGRRARFGSSRSYSLSFNCW
jgi:hypothetical protein